MIRTAAVVPVLLAVACAGVGSDPRPGQDRPDDQLYEISTTVLESKAHGPMLCPGGMTASLPPQCGNVPITNWDWDAVAREERLSGTIWGAYHVVGTYDGKAFTVTETGPAREWSDGFSDGPIVAGCQEPQGGWELPDPDRTSEGDLNAAQRLARGEPDFAGFWIDYLDKPREEPIDDQRIVITAAFTGDLDRHEDQLREVWGGPLCVIEHPRTYRELRRIQKEFTDSDVQGLGHLGSSVDVVDNVVELYVVLLDDEDRRRLDQRYGEGTVRATSALTPVEP